jgi:serine/threonine protein kinase
MTVWNLGCILLHLIVSSHKLSNKTIMEKFKGKPFTFEAINIKSDRVNNLSTNLKDLLSVMLHYDPKRRMKLQSLFENSFASVEVSKHAIENK